MSYPKISKVQGVRRGGKKIDKDIPYIWASQFGSKKSNSGAKATNWFERYRKKNNARQCKMSRNG